MSIKYTEKELKEDIKQIAEDIGHPPTCSEYDKHGTASLSTLRRRFGSYTNAIKAAGYQPNRGYTDKELKEDIRRVTEKIGHPPTCSEYDKHGTVSAHTLSSRFGCFTDAIKSAGYQPTVTADGVKHTKEDIKQDIRRVVNDLGKVPTRKEYNKHGDASRSAAARCFGTWNKAIRATGYQPYRESSISKEEILLDIRRCLEEESIKEPTVIDYMSSTNAKYGNGTIDSKFSSRWIAIVRAGIRPHRSLPLSPLQYKSFIQAAIDGSPRESLYGQLMAFTGLTQRLLTQFELGWVTRLESDARHTLITVPSEHLKTDDDWVITVPDSWTDPVADTTKQTTINGLLEFFNSMDYLYESGMMFTHISELLSSNIDIERGNIKRRLRATNAIHLARRQIPAWRIEHQHGGEKTNCDRSVEDYLEYLYQFESFTHRDYQPVGTYLDPDTGEPYTPE